ncbi:VacJ family lipoprotein [Spiribacter sp. 221]|uniref:MlaA family lipoprotein n=1 Tax=Spiribacter onubensis TaxID=3122420 RepID=UPI00349F6E5A
MNLSRTIAMLLLALLLAGCASSGNQAANDPLEGFNRGVYAFNDELDNYVIGPASRGWTRVTSPDVRNSVSNFFHNLESPGYILNDLLQGKPADAGRETLRFVVNSTVGILGFFDPASSWLGIEGRPEDFGQTLGTWGVDSGPYLVLPLFGPSSPRDATSYPVAYYTNVLTYVAIDTLTFGTLTAVNIVNSRAELEGAARFRDDAAIDPYVFTRSAYRQYRRNALYDGNPPMSDDPYSDFLEDMDADPDI